MTAPRKHLALEDSAFVFAALGDPTRLRLVARLCDGGPLSIARLTSESDFTRQAITKHLRVLADAGLVHVARQGRETRWEMDPRQLEVARRYLDRIAVRWDDRLQALKQHVEKRD
jgi:DNA-binding transcriptional ArsR family regulator